MRSRNCWRHGTNENADHPSHLEGAMKMLFLCKRRYMNHDVITDRYGRLYHLPDEIALLGHDVYGFCLSYQNAPPVNQTHRKKSQESGLLSWHSLPAGLFGTKIPLYLLKVARFITSIQPDVIVGGSDALHAILARFFSRRANVPYFLDLYDNFESFGLTRFPGILWGYHRALRDAEGLTTISKALERYVQSKYPNKPVTAIESTVSPNIFKPFPKNESREFFNLPVNAILIGTAGSLSQSRDTSTLYEAFKNVHTIMPNTVLVLAGPSHGNPPPEHPAICYLGELPHTLIPRFFSSLNLAIICMRDDDFGRYAFPQKAYEMLACGTTVIAAKVGALQELFEQHEDFLYRPGNIDDLTTKILNQLRSILTIQLPVPSWHDQAKKFESFLLKSQN